MEFLKLLGVWALHVVGSFVVMVLLMVTFIGSTSRLSASELRMPMLWLGAGFVLVPLVAAALLTRFIWAFTEWPARVLLVLAFVAVQVVMVVVIGFGTIVSLNR